MKKNHKKIKSIIAMLLVFSTIITCGPSTIIANAADTPSTSEIVKLTTDADQGTILHAWDWSFNNIKDKVVDIKAAGYSAIQVSPIQPSKDSTTKLTSGLWYMLYQPVEFSVGNVQLGTEEEFKAMCDAAHDQGLKIIVDVVSNHTGNNGGDGNVTIAPQVKFQGTGYEDYWHNPLHAVKSWDDRYEVTHGGLSLPDLNTANPKVQAMVRSFLENCLADGADGLRFDTAKHLELPYPLDDEKTSSNYWPAVLGGLKTNDGTTPFVYGEDLQGGADKFAEYTKLMDVTASNYGGTIRSIVGIGSKIDYFSDENFANYKSYNVPSGVDPSSLITWVESHDTYANSPDVSLAMTPEQIADGWALIASRAGSTPLYFNRTAGRTKLQGNIGDAGNDDWKNPDVVAVNKFHNAMKGKDETITKVSDKVVMIERGTEGLVIVNLGDAIADFNTATKLVDGTYNNCATAGGTFAVAGGNITGALSKGITVLYAGGVTEPKSITPKVSINKENCSFTGTLDLALKVENGATTSYSIDGVDKGPFTDGQIIKIGGDATLGKKITVNVSAISADGTTVSETYNYMQKDPNAKATVYFTKPADWQPPNIYIYNELNEAYNSKSWPGSAMEKIGTNLYRYEIKGFTDCKVIFNYGSTQTADLPITANGMKIYDANESWADTDEIAKDPNVTPDVIELGSTVYVKVPDGWTGIPNLHYWNAGGLTTTWPGIAMTDKGNGLYSGVIPKSFGDVSIIINDGNNKITNTEGKNEFAVKLGSSIIFENGEWKEYVEQGISKIYFRKPKDWAEPNVYAYKIDGNVDSKVTAEVNAWPGVPMEKVDGTETLYSYTFSKDCQNINVIFNDKVKDKDGGNQFPTSDGYKLLSGESKIYDNGSLRDFTSADLEEPFELGSTVYVKVPDGWAGIPNLHYWNAAGKATAWPGIVMTDEGNGLYSGVIPKSFGDVTIIFNDGSNKITDKDGNSEFKVVLGSSRIFENGEWKDYVKTPTTPEEPTTPEDPTTPEEPGQQETSKTPTVAGTVYTSSSNVNGTAGANADITLTVDIQTTTSAGAKVETEEKEIGSAKADKDGNWSVKIPNQYSGTVIKVTAREDGKLESCITVTVIKKSSSHSSSSSSSSSSNNEQTATVNGNTTTIKSTDAITIGKEISNSTTSNIKIDLASQKVVDKGIFKALASNPSKTLTLVGDNASWTFNGANILANGATNIDTTIKSTSQNATLINNLVGGKEVVNLSFAYKGVLPGKAEIKASVDPKYNDKIMSIYSYNLANNRLALVSSDVAVKDGIATFEVTKGSDYILSETAIPGAVKEGWNQNTDGSWIFVKEENNATGWIKDGANWYKCDQSGVMQTKWVNDSDGKWYYLNASGAMKTGWINDNGNWYYLDQSGAMLSNTSVDGYTLGTNGAWIA